MEIIAEPHEPLARELGVVICDDRVQNPEPVDYVGEKLHGLLGLDLSDRCKDRWTKRGVNWAFFKFLKQNKATLTYAMLVRLNSPTG